MKFYKLAYPIYSLARATSRVTGINRILRRSVGPWVGRFIFKISENKDTPLLIQGHKMFLAPAGRYPSPDMVVDKYESATTDLFRQILKPGMTVIDVGANVGYFSLLAADLVGSSGTVYAFEPEPENNTLLLTNIEINSYTNIRAKKVAVSNTCGSTDFFLSELDNGSHSIYEAGARGVAATLSVETTTLDAFIEEEEWPVVDLLKIDVEGAELMVLEGMELLNKRSNRIRLILEYCPFLIQAAGANPLELLQKLTSMNFQIRFVDEKNGGLLPADSDLQYVTSRLLRQETYMNILCSRK